MLIKTKKDYLKSVARSDLCGFGLFPGADSVWIYGTNKDAELAVLLLVAQVRMKGSRRRAANQCRSRHGAVLRTRP